MYDKQIQLKSDTPFRLSRLPKSGSCTSRQNAPESLYFLVFIFRSGNSIVLPRK